MVDAAICLPLFIIALGMMLQVINFIGIEERGYFDAESRICTVGVFGSDISLGKSVNDSSIGVSIDYVQTYPITYSIKFPFSGAFLKSKLAIMDMPYRTYIGESKDLYDKEYVYIFPKNEGNEKEQPKYHFKFCRTMKAGTTKSLQTERITKSDAINRGYTECYWCNHDGQ